MRVFVAALVSTAVLGSVAAFTWEPPAALVEISATEPESAEGEHTLEVTATFAAKPDPFSLEAPGADSVTLLVRVNGVEAVRQSGTLEAGEPILVDGVEGIVLGRNEIYVEARPPIEEAGQAHAVRIRFLRNGVAEAERTVWSRPNEPVAKVVAIEVDQDSEDES